MAGMTILLSVDISTQYCIYFFVGIVAVAGAIKDMGALTKLDISGNNIKQGEAEALEQITVICSAKSIELTGAGFNEQDNSDY
jgi:hypothetical protein